jgi:prepilin-type N-terminal cleavage/methylation domain-containing protein/prepilin-type processing-associated H-X9-DG protein
MSTEPGGRHRAFTLLELLVVIAILCLLLAILLPSFNRAREAARRVACMSNLAGMGTGLTGYIFENQGVLPPLAANVVPEASQLPWNDPVGHPWAPATGLFLRWPDFIAKYFDGEAKPMPLNCSSLGGGWGYSVGVQPQSGNYYENLPVVESKRMRCPSQPRNGPPGFSVIPGFGWNLPPWGDQRYNMHYMLCVSSTNHGPRFPDVWSFPAGYTPIPNEQWPDFIQSRLTDYQADQQAAIVEPTLPCLPWFSWAYDNLTYSNNFQFDCTWWLPFLPHDGAAPPPPNTSDKCTVVVPPRTDNPSMNTVFLDGHVQNLTYQWMVNWENIQTTRWENSVPPHMPPKSILPF